MQQGGRVLRDFCWYLTVAHCSPALAGAEPFPAQLPPLNFPTSGSAKGAIRIPRVVRQCFSAHISRLGGSSFRSVALLLLRCCKSHRCLPDVITEIDLPRLAFLCNKAQQRFANSQRFHHGQFCFSI